MNKFISFIKNWTLPVAIVIGSVAYLTFYWVPAFDTLGDQLSPIFDVIFPLFVFLTLLITFCKVDYHQLLPHRWHTGSLAYRRSDSPANAHCRNYWHHILGGG